MAQGQRPVYLVANRNLVNRFVLAFQLHSPRRVAQALAQYRTDAYCERNALLEARGAQPLAWQQEFDHWCARWGVSLE